MKKKTTTATLYTRVNVKNKNFVARAAQKAGLSQSQFVNNYLTKLRTNK